MDRRLIECVPNFSDGQDQKVIDAIANAIKTTKGVNLLGVDPGQSTNRTVYTFVGTPNAVVEGAFNAVKVALELIDMTKHKGEHPRLGAMDVCPFVPVRNSTMEDCVECARILGRRLGEELSIPIYLYGYASTLEYRKTVPQIRAGEYEGLKDKITLDDWKPNFGPARFVPKWGASMVGARKFLLAYNINMLSTKEQAHRIALDLREQGRGKGKEGKLKGVQGIGWWLKEANMAQISFNLTDQELCPLHVAFEEAKKGAEALNLSVVGSELVGLVPLSAIMAAADYYIQKESLCIFEPDQKVRLAIDRLGLSSLYPFDPKDRIIEWKVEATDPPKPLLDISVTSFVNEVRQGSPPARVCCISWSVASLTSMVGLLTYGKRQWEHLDKEMRSLILPLYSIVDEVLPLVEADTEAFESYVKACRETKNPDSEEAQKALLDAINVPLELARKLSSLWPHIEQVATLGNPNCLSDIQVGIKCLETGIWGARCNVLINCGSLADANTKVDLVKEANFLYDTAKHHASRILRTLEKDHQAEGEK
ncbi:Formimidoyltransferase-cyclodeaminase [Orchesella cincta]|uniref:Formimidoyltransferase-cyclodeaminase n=1 Tax=Orchesella cincta TaxID=48709 RepID=A0A1D2MS78_ORCCI|nr:Formimidoyltransferase-cyclodeaminase [Orchesella cincta]